MSKYFWAHLKLYCGSIKGTSVNFHSQEKQGQFDSGIQKQSPRGVL